MGNDAVIATMSSFIIGSLVLSFGVVKPMQMVSDVCREPSAGFEGRLASHVLICECASRAALFGAAISGSLGLISALQHLGGDFTVVSYRVGNALVGPVYGAIISASVFSPLKHRFLAIKRRSVRQAVPRSGRSLSMDFLLVITGFAVTVYLIIAYLFKFIPFLVDTLRQ